MNSKRQINLRLPHSDPETRIRALEAQVRSQQAQLAQLLHAKYLLRSELLLSDLGLARQQLQARRRGHSFDESQQALALKYARFIAQKSRELPAKSSSWQGFEEAAANAELSGLLLASLQLLSEDVLNQLERPQIEDVLTPISGSVLYPQSFLSKDDFFDHQPCSLSVSFSPSTNLLSGPSN
jgi:hypothetical protein